MVSGQIKAVANKSFLPNKDYTFRSVSGFTLKGRNFLARSFKDVIRGIHGADFDAVALRLHGKKRSYFSKSSDGLKFPVQLSGKNFFVETNLSANGVVKISGRLLSELGYNEREFEITQNMYVRLSSCACYWRPFSFLRLIRAGTLIWPGVFLLRFLALLILLVAL